MAGFVGCERRSKSAAPGGRKVRRLQEDQTLHEELSGYKDYAMRVGYKLIPGVW